MPRPKDETIWRDLSDDEYAHMQTKSWASKAHPSELTLAERGDFQSHYPTQFEAAQAIHALAEGALVPCLRPAQRAAMSQLCPELLAAYEDDQAKVLAPMIAEPWRFKQWSELRPTERAQWAAAEPEAYANARAAHQGAR